MGGNHRAKVARVVAALTDDDRPPYQSFKSLPLAKLHKLKLVSLRTASKFGARQWAQNDGKTTGSKALLNHRDDTPNCRLSGTLLRSERRQQQQTRNCIFFPARQTCPIEMIRINGGRKRKWHQQKGAEEGDCKRVPLFVQAQPIRRPFCSPFLALRLFEAAANDEQVRLSECKHSCEQQRPNWRHHSWPALVES